MVIEVLKHVPHCYSFEDGLIIAGLIACAINRSEVALVDFTGVNGTPSSFVNGAFVTLLDRYDYDDIKRYIRVINSSKQINTMIKERLAKASSERKSFA
ncbi:DUF4325 domain-containing protein [Kozakia baliensis]|uniref:STAS-like domain-containing protein n=1 Tax=Kozakia baliensis TaxID=153496 RepID=UPI00345BFD7D